MKTRILAFAVLSLAAYAAHSQDVEWTQSPREGAFPALRMPQDAGRALPAGGVILWLDPRGCPAGFKKLERLEGLYLRIGEPMRRGGSATHAHKASVDIAHTHSAKEKSDKYEFGFEKFLGSIGGVVEATRRDVGVEAA